MNNNSDVKLEQLYWQINQQNKIIDTLSAARKVVRILICAGIVIFNVGILSHGMDMFHFWEDPIRMIYFANIGFLFGLLISLYLCNRIIWNGQKQLDETMKEYEALKNSFSAE